jgi:fatty acid desaturase
MAAGERRPAKQRAEEEAAREDFRRRRRVKNWVLLVALAGFAALVYVVAIIRMGGG